MYAICQITQLGSNANGSETATTAEIRDLRDQIERLADAVAMTSRRMGTLEMTSDMEFRLLRMEKRLRALMNLGGDELARAAVGRHHSGRRRRPGYEPRRRHR